MKRFVFVLVALFASIATFADLAYPDSICVIQPNGDTLWTYLHGDEFYHWRSTIDGNVILRDTSNYYRYAIIESNSLKASTIVAHNVEERSVLEHAFLSSNRSYIQQFIHSKILEAYDLVERNDTSILPPAQSAAISYVNREPVIGTRRILTVLVDFKDFSFTRTRTEFDNLMNQPNGKVGQNQGSVRQYYRENSYGQLDVVSTVVGPFRAMYKRSHYDFKNNGNIFDTKLEIRELVHEAIDYAKDFVDFSALDGDNDGYVDCVHVVFAGEGLSSGSENSYIWPHTSELAFAVSQKGTKVKAKTYIITPEILWLGQLASIGTICHELGHVFGAPDFFHNDTLRSIGQYDLMNGGQWNNGGYTPPHHNPYTKCYLFGWDEPTLISSSTKEYVVSSATKGSGNFYRINTQTDNEFFLLENRSLDSFDQYIPNHGLLLYHAHPDLDLTIKKKKTANDVHPLKLYLVDASAASNPSSNLDSYGVLTTKRAFPGIDNDKTMFTSTTIPSAKAWNGSDLGVNLYFIRETASGDIAFTVNPQIQGPSQLCGTQDYYIVGDLPDSDKVIWSYSTDIAESPMYPALLFDEDNDAGVISIQRGNTIDNPSKEQDSPILRSYDLINPMPFPEVPYVGAVTLNATVHGGNGTYQMEKELELPEFVTPSLAPSYTHWPIYAERTLSDTACTNIESEHIRWYVRYPNSLSEYEYMGHDVTLQPVESGEMEVRIVNSCGCEASNEATYTYSVVNAGPMSYPNPVTTAILPIDIMRYDDDAALCTIELWHYAQGRVDSMSTTGNRIELYVSDLPADWYQVVLLRNGQIIDSGNVLISH